MSKTASTPTGRRFLLCAAVALGGLGLAGNAAAADNSGTSTANTTDEVPTDEMIVCALDAPIEPMIVSDASAAPIAEAFATEIAIDDGIVIDDGCMLPPVDPATVNAEQDELAAYLDAHGIAYEMITEGEFHWVEIDYEDEAAANALDDFYWEKYPMPQDVIDQINSDAESLAAFLRDRGIEVTVITDRHGLQYADFDWENVDVQTALDDYYWSQNPLPQDVIDQINADADALAAFLQSKGFEVTVTTDRHGIKTAEWDWENTEIQAALEEYWGSQVFTIDGVEVDPMPFELAGDTGVHTVAAAATGVRG